MTLVSRHLMRVSTALVLATLPLTDAAAQTRAPAAAPRAIPYRMVRSPVSGAVLPRITLATRQARAVNTRLDTLAAGLRCDPVRGRRAQPYEVRSRVTYAADDVFSVFILASWFCGGPYPTDDANLSATYDLRTGREVPFHALFANYGRDGMEIVRTIFPRQVARARRPAPDNPNERNQCDGIIPAEELPDQVEVYSLSPQGLTAEIVFAHAVAVCGERVTIPYARLRRFAAPGSILARVADAQRRLGNRAGVRSPADRSSDLENGGSASTALHPYRDIRITILAGGGGSG
ncbi:hypothetical protein [Longimicrobium sp.]|uniref:hypothetical protein n=1 Tax=Longimicrobium sp. TaxID=2029185 RepID=UPI002C9852BF|nr:hypothetical protein [Longimicrobium sp.]HSU13058.1 hypothetical protein [Longimicrobium sp.]